MNWRTPATYGEPPLDGPPIDVDFRRIIEPGTLWALSRRTTRRYFLLNPDQSRELEQCYWYCLGLAADRCGSLRIAAE